MFMIWIKF